jgi:hypothetical protein
MLSPAVMLITQKLTPLTKTNILLTMTVDRVTLRHEDAWESGGIQVFLISALVGREWSPSLPDRFTPGERAPGTHWIGGWVGPRTGLDDDEE